VRGVFVLRQFVAGLAAKPFCLARATADNPSEFLLPLAHGLIVSSEDLHVVRRAARVFSPELIAFQTAHAISSPEITYAMERPRRNPLERRTTDRRLCNISLCRNTRVCP
jgi:hypothetical protein